MVLASDLKGSRMRASVVYLNPLECADGTPRGCLTVSARFEFVTIMGEPRGRNVRVHQEYSSNIEEAKGSVSTMRANNPGMNIIGRFVIYL